MLPTIIFIVCEFISNFLHAVLRTLLPVSARGAEPYFGPGHRAFMEELTPQQQALRELKARFLKALLRNDAQEVQTIIQKTNLDVDIVLDVEDSNRVLASYKKGNWLPDYKLERSWAMGLHVCMMYNALESALVLLMNGAMINPVPNGKTPLHVACSASHADCVALLLAHDAMVNKLSLSGHTALHHCTTRESVDCAKQVILKGGEVNMPSQNRDEDTPLHIAARFGVPELAALYLAHGAAVNAVNTRLETPLFTAVYWAFDIKDQTYSQNHQLVCRILLDHKADPNIKEIDLKTALHKAAWSFDHVLIQMLLEAGADTHVMDMNGCGPIHYFLKVIDVRPMAVHELCFQLMLNHTTARFYPPQFHKVLQACYDYPGVVEIMVNVFEHLKPTRNWRAAIPDECYQRHEGFYDSLFAVCSNTPRTLLHLARCAIRTQLRGRCHTGVGQLHLPPSIKKYLLLEPEGILY